MSETTNLNTMESTTYQDPQDDQITNNDDSVTNKDGDNNLEQGQEANVQDQPDEERVTTVTPNNDNENPTQTEEPEDDSSNKGQGPSGENL